MDGVLGGLAVVALITACMCALVGAVLYQRQVAALARRIARRIAPPPELAAGRPIERIARDARRLQAELLALAPGTPMARRRGLAQAYDDLLGEACRALGVPDTLSALPMHRRDAERMRVEHELDRAGLRLGA